MGQCHLTSGACTHPVWASTSPLHEADSGGLQSKWIGAPFPSPTPPPPGPTMPSPLDAASPPPSPCFWTDTWEIWKLEPSQRASSLDTRGELQPLVASESQGDVEQQVALHHWGRGEVVPWFTEEADKGLG